MKHYIYYGVIFLLFFLVTFISCSDNFDSEEDNGTVQKSLVKEDILKRISGSNLKVNMAKRIITGDTIIYKGTVNNKKSRTSGTCGYKIYVDKYINWVGPNYAQSFCGGTLTTTMKEVCWIIDGAQMCTNKIFYFGDLSPCEIEFFENLIEKDPTGAIERFCD